MIAVEDSVDGEPLSVTITVAVRRWSCSRPRTEIEQVLLVDVQPLVTVPEDGGVQA